jgi:fatty-acyl-CoA synthase
MERLLTMGENVGLRMTTASSNGRRDATDEREDPSLWDLLAGAPRPETALHTPLIQPEPMPLVELMERAEHTAADIQLRVKEPRRLGILMANGEPWFRGLLAAIRMGAAAVPLALPVAFGGAEAFRAHVARLASDAELDAILIDSSTHKIASRLDSAIDGVALIDISEPGSPGPIEMVSDGRGEDLAIIQYTSGSTSAPKGVALTHRNVCAGILPLTSDLGWVEGEDASGIWIPLFHDMGLFSSMASFARGSSVFVWQPGDFVRRRNDWLISFAESGATVLAAPNFGFDYLLGAAAAGLPKELDLSGWRVACNGSEPVRQATVQAFIEAFEPYGLAPETMVPVYGMAEATLGVSFHRQGTLSRFETVDRDTVTDGGTVERTSPDDPAARTVASVGRAVTGLELRLGDAEGNARAEGVVGEIQIRGEAIMKGYLGIADDQQPFTPDGWLRTGDLGFQLDGDLFITGRSKDVVIVRGQNYYAEDVEEIVSSLDRIRKRHVAAVGVNLVDGDEAVCVLFESDLDANDEQEAIAEIRDAVSTRLGPIPLGVTPVAPRTLPFTSSGKVKRQAVRKLYEEGGLAIATTSARGAGSEEGQ